MPDSSEPGTVRPNQARDKMVRKGIASMADENMEDAATAFEAALMIDPNHVESLLKLGYARFHRDDLAGAMESYDKVHEISATNSEAWNLKSLIHHRQKNYEKALKCVEKSIETDPTKGMAWYNKACYHALLNNIPQSIEALKRSIELDVKNAEKAVMDRDLENVKKDEEWRRIVEVAVLESVRRGHRKVSQIVRTTKLGNDEVEKAAKKLFLKGYLVRAEKNIGSVKIEEYEIVPEVAAKIGNEKKGPFGSKKR